MRAHRTETSAFCMELLRCQRRRGGVAGSSSPFPSSPPHTLSQPRMKPFPEPTAKRRPQQTAPTRSTKRPKLPFCAACKPSFAAPHIAVGDGECNGRRQHRRTEGALAEVQGEVAGNEG
eukprot:1800816-Rhodomonas_salina.1